MTCNPPYVPEGLAVPPEVHADPHGAVFAGPDGLDVIRPVAALAHRLLRPGGAVALEHDDSHPAAVREVLAVAGFADVTTHDDLTGRPRVATACAGFGALGWPAVSTTYDCEDPATRPTGLAAAAAAVRAGRLVVVPTDTLYGIGADAFSARAVADLLAAKQRGPDMPVPVLVGSWSTIDGLVGAVPRVARDLVEAFWPGGLSIVLPHAPSLAWDLGRTRGTVMLRMPLHPVALELLREVGPMAVTQRERLRPRAGDHGRPTPASSWARASRSTSTAGCARRAWPRRSSTSPATSPACAARAPSRPTRSPRSSARPSPCERFRAYHRERRSRGDVTQVPGAGRAPVNGR